MRLFLAKSQRPPYRRTAWWTRKDSNCVPGTQSYRTGLCEAARGLSGSQNSAVFAHSGICLTREQVSSMRHFVSKSLVARLPLTGHFCQQGFLRIDIVVDDDLPFRRMEPMKSARILRKGSAPRYGHREKQRIKACIVEALT